MYDVIVASAQLSVNRKNIVSYVGLMEYMYKQEGGLKE